MIRESAYAKMIMHRIPLIIRVISLIPILIILIAALRLVQHRALVIL
jgi:hypothetical protein